MEAPREEIPVHYIKSNDFRTVFASGFHGGISAQGLISMNTFIDRPPIPVKSVFRPIADSVAEGSLPTVKEETLEVREGIIREVQIGIIMDLNTAKSLITWLNDKIQVLENALPHQ